MSLCKQYQSDFLDVLLTYGRLPEVLLTRSSWLDLNCQETLLSTVLGFVFVIGSLVLYLFITKFNKGTRGEGRVLLEGSGVDS